MLTMSLCSTFPLSAYVLMSVYFAGSNSVARADHHGEAAEDGEQNSHLHEPWLSSLRKSGCSSVVVPRTISHITNWLSPFSAHTRSHTHAHTLTYVSTLRLFCGLCTAVSQTPTGPLQPHCYSIAIIKGKVHLSHSGFDLLVLLSSQLFMCQPVCASLFAVSCFVFSSLCVYWFGLHIGSLSYWSILVC